MSETQQITASDEALIPIGSLHEEALSAIQSIDYVVGEIRNIQYLGLENQASLRAIALISDARSLVEGIANGSITASQPRIVASLIAAVEDLINTRNHEFADLLVSVIRRVSSSGMAADNTDLSLIRRRTTRATER